MRKSSPEEIILPIGIPPYPGYELFFARYIEDFLSKDLAILKFKNFYKAGNRFEVVARVFENTVYIKNFIPEKLKKLIQNLAAERNIPTAIILNGKITYKSMRETKLLSCLTEVN